MEKSGKRQANGAEKKISVAPSTPVGALKLKPAAQYLGGLLFRKARAPIFQRLAALRRSVRAAAAKSPAAAPAQEATWP